MEESLRGTVTRELSSRSQPTVPSIWVSLWVATIYLVAGDCGRPVALILSPTSCITTPTLLLLTKNSPVPLPHAVMAMVCSGVGKGADRKIQKRETKMVCPGPDQGSPHSCSPAFIILREGKLQIRQSRRPHESDLCSLANPAWKAAWKLSTQLKSPSFCRNGF